MEIKLEKIPNTKGHKLIIAFADGKEIYTTIKGNVANPLSRTMRPHGAMSPQ